MNFRRDVVTDTYGSFLSDDEVRGQVKCGWNSGLDVGFHHTCKDANV